MSPSNRSEMQLPIVLTKQPTSVKGECLQIYAGRQREKNVFFFQLKKAECIYHQILRNEVRNTEKRKRLQPVTMGTQSRLTKAFEVGQTRYFARCCEAAKSAQRRKKKNFTICVYINQIIFIFAKCKKDNVSLTFIMQENKKRFHVLCYINK